jgi:hypothetical protein
LLGTVGVKYAVVPARQIVKSGVLETSPAGAGVVVVGEAALGRVCTTLAFSDREFGSQYLVESVAPTAFDIGVVDDPPGVLNLAGDACRVPLSATDLI